MKPITCPITSELIQSPEFSPNNGEFSLFLTAFEELDILGSGAFGTVVRCRNRADNREYAIKKVQIGSIKEYGVQKVVRETQILSGLNDECNIVRYHTGWFESRLNGKWEECSDGALTSNDKFPCLYIQMELCERSLEEILGEGKMKEKEYWGIFEKIANCLQHIHAKGFMHGDLSCRNVFFKENEVKIGDFGLARYLEEGGNIEEVHINVDTIDEPIISKPPEKEVSMKYDIYCAGVILLRMLSSTVEDEELDPYWTWVAEKTFPPTWEDDLNKFLSSLLHKDPAMRPSTSEMVSRVGYFTAKAQ